MFGPMEVPTGERVLVGLDPQGAVFGWFRARTIEDEEREDG